MTRPVSLFLLRALAAASLAALTAACGSADRVANIGKAPELTAIQNPVAVAGYRPVQMPMPEPEVAHYEPNSLWQSGARSFFKDQRAQSVGDLVTVLVRITDSANFSNESERARNGSESAGASGAVGNAIDQFFLPSGSSAEALVNLNGTGSYAGEGSIERSEELTTTIAAVVTQVLPNGNLVIEGRQEVRVNFEVRDLIVAGVVRPQDIDFDNTVDSANIAEARISYGGRGQITDVQQPRYGQQLIDIITPF